MIATIMDFIVQGGVFMVFLLVLSVVTLGIILWRGFALRREAVLPKRIVQAIEEIEAGESMEKVVEAVEGSASALGSVVRVLVQHQHWPMDEAREAIQTSARREVAQLEKGLVFLEMATGVAPLFGLLGTLSGLVSVFANLGQGGDPVLVARGISEALNTTIVGLSIAAPSLVAYHYFERKIEMMSIEMESLVGDLLIKLYQYPNQSHRSDVG